MLPTCPSARKVFATLVVHLVGGETRFVHIVFYGIVNPTIELVNLASQLP